MRYTLLLFTLLIFSLQGQAAFAPATVSVPDATTTLTSADLSRDAVEARLGRKLKFKERVGLSIARGSLKRAEKREARGKRGGGAPADGFAITSLVCGILGLVLFFPAIPAVVFGILSLNRFKRDPQYRTGKGMAIAGLVLGGLVVILFLVLILLFLSFGLF